MAINNDIYYNAVLTGYFSGLLAGRDLSSLSAGAITAAKTEAAALALEVDALIPEDATVTTGGGDASQLGNAALLTDIISAEQWKGTLLWGIAQAAGAGRYAASGTTPPASLAAAIAAAFNSAKTSITNAP